MGSGGAARVVARIVSLHTASQQLRPDPAYLDESEEGCLLRNQRESVVSFLSELTEDFQLDPQTATLAINYFDRHCSTLKAGKRGIKRERVQIIAMTCLMLASKFYDRKTPSIVDLSKIAQHVYTHEEFREQELEVLASLQWLLHVPTPQTFFTALLRIVEMRSCSDDPMRGSLAGPCLLKIRKWGSILLDLSAFEYDFLRFSPLVIALASFHCAARFENVSFDSLLTEKLEAIHAPCNISQDDVMACAQAVMTYYELCFPDSPKAELAVFMPVTPENERREINRCDAQSPDNVMARDLSSGCNGSKEGSFKRKRS